MAEQPKTMPSEGMAIPEEYAGRIISLLGEHEIFLPIQREHRLKADLVRLIVGACILERTDERKRQADAARKRGRS